MVLAWVAAVGAATAVDRPVAQWVQAHRPLDKPMAPGKVRVGGNHPVWATRVVRLPGDYRFVLFCGLGLAFFHPRRWGAAVPVFLSGPVVGAAYTVLKWVVGRRRPVIEIAPFTFHPFINGVEGLFRSVSGLAFPSGDATMAFAFATCMAAALPPWWAAFFAWAGLVAAERVLENAHYVSDVIAGAGLGVLCGLLVLYLGRRYLCGSSRMDAEVTPCAPAAAHAGE